MRACFDSPQLVYALKSVGNLGLAAPVFVPLLTHFMLGPSSPLELRLAAVRALRRYPCSVDVSLVRGTEAVFFFFFSQRGGGECQSTFSC